MSSLAKLTSQSTQTLSLLLERQRLLTLPTSTTTNSLHLPQITRNLNQLRIGILDLEEKTGSSEAVRLLKSQYERMRGMLGPEGDAAGVQSLDSNKPKPELDSQASSSSSSFSLPPSTSPHPPPAPLNGIEGAGAGAFAPYTDDPEAGYTSNVEVLQAQRQLMDEQDVHLDRLSHSVNRQRDISLQIGDELEVHTGLLEGLDQDLDHTGSRLSNARRRLNRVAKGTKENGSTVLIGLLILVLLILIIIFKT